MNSTRSRDYHPARAPRGKYFNWIPRKIRTMPSTIFTSLFQPWYFNASITTNTNFATTDNQLTGKKARAIYVTRKITNYQRLRDNFIVFFFFSYFRRTLIDVWLYVYKNVKHDDDSCKSNVHENFKFTIARYDSRRLTSNTGNYVLIEPNDLTTCRFFASRQIFFVTFS